MRDSQKILRLYAKNRKLPAAVKLGTISKDWIEYARIFSSKIANTSDAALSQRNKKNIYGTEIENYDSLTKFYNQRYFDNIDLPKEITQLNNVHHLRFGVLDFDKTLPFHLDEPYNLRFICIIQGSHDYYSEKGELYQMTEGELWFINGSFKHSVKNTSAGNRIALLGKFPPDDKNLKLINELL
jgi:quercetin dioxygenase-like cupin family protein